MAQENPNPRPRKAPRIPNYPTLTTLAIAAALSACGGQLQGIDGDRVEAGGADAQQAGGNTGTIPNPEATGGRTANPAGGIGVPYEFGGAGGSGGWVSDPPSDGEGGEGGEGGDAAAGGAANGGVGGTITDRAGGRAASGGSVGFGGSSAPLATGGSIGSGTAPTAGFGSTIAAEGSSPFVSPAGTVPLSFYAGGTAAWPTAAGGVPTVAGAAGTAGTAGVAGAAAVGDGAPPNGRGEYPD